MTSIEGHHRICPQLCGSTLTTLTDFALFKLRLFRPAQLKKRKRPTVYVWLNTEACSCNHCDSGKSISITYSECVFVTLGTPACKTHAPYRHLWPVWLYSIFPHYLIQRHDFSTTKKVNEQKGLFWFSLWFCLKLTLIVAPCISYNHFNY